MRIDSALAQAVTGLLLLTAPARAAGPPPRVPAIGDTLTYAISTGERVTLRTTNVRQEGDRVIATDQETVESAGAGIRQGSIDVIRTDDALAFSVPSVGNERLSPLVFFFAPANVQDSWLAQRVSFLDPRGQPVSYRVLAEVAAIETVTSPAGMFPGCWRVAFSTGSAGTSRLLVWLKPDLGIIRTQSEYQGRTLVTELTGFDLASR